MNYTILKGKYSYILFVNQNEPEDSRLQYDLLKQENKNEIVEEKTFESDGQFGFSAVTKFPEEKYELIVNLGGVKLSTISEDKKIDDKIQEMMEIVKTVKVVN